MDLIIHKDYTGGTHTSIHPKIYELNSILHAANNLPRHLNIPVEQSLRPKCNCTDPTDSHSEEKKT